MPVFNSMMHLDKDTYQCISGSQILEYRFGQPNCMPKLKEKWGKTTSAYLVSFIFQANVSTHYLTFSLNNTLKSTDHDCVY